jgi:hypothetical protein
MADWYLLNQFIGIMQGYFGYLGAIVEIMLRVLGAPLYTGLQNLVGV